MPTDFAPCGEQLSAEPGPAPPRPVPRLLGIVLAAVPVAFLIGCAPDDPVTVAGECVLNTAAVCNDCLQLEHQLRIGSAAGPGFIDGRGGEDQIVRLLLESGSRPSDSLTIEMDWEEVGAVGFAYSLEGAADAIREAGGPCGIG